jgi:hypothetical protein
MKKLSPSRQSVLTVNPSRKRSMWSRGTRIDEEDLFRPRSFTGIAWSRAVACLASSVSPRALEMLMAFWRWDCFAMPLLASASSR